MANERARGQSLEAWAHAVVRQRVASLERELDRLVRKPEPEAIHQVRVATRRLRAALRHFSCCFRKGKANEMRNSIRSFAGTLGEMRDLDILMENLEEDAKDSKSPLAGLVKRLQARRNEALYRALPEARMLRQRLGDLHQKMKN